MLPVPLLHSEPAALASLGSLAGLAALGAFHGLNPAMGWLFAVALGLQQGTGWAISRALVFITAGHVASLVVIAVVLAFIGSFVPLGSLRIIAGAVLLLFGAYKLFRYYRHPRWVGMRVGPRDLFVWSFLMATSHGAGLMLAPIILNLDEAGPGSRRGVVPPCWLPGLGRYVGGLGDRSGSAHRGHAAGDVSHSNGGLQKGGAGVFAVGLGERGPSVGGRAIPDRGRHHPAGSALDRAFDRSRANRGDP